MIRILVKTCYESGKYEEEILADAEDGSALGITGTPGFVIGILSEDGTVEGYLLSGALPFESFEAVIQVLQKRNRIDYFFLVFVLLTFFFGGFIRSNFILKKAPTPTNVKTIV